MNTSPYEHLKQHIGKKIEVLTYNNKKYEGVFKGVDTYSNIYLCQVLKDAPISKILINGVNVMMINFL